MDRIQPLRKVMTEQRWSVRRLAEEIGVSISHLQSTIQGRARPQDIVRKRLPEILNTPLEELYDDDMIFLPYRSQYKMPRKTEPVDSNG